jgi:hypothetical protein
MNPRLSHEQSQVRRYGWSGLFAWALLGFALEAAHAWKWATYLDDELARYLLRLAHAHGVLLSVLCLVYSSAGVRLLEQRPDCGRPVRLQLIAACLLMPTGFALSVLGHTESDPGLAIWLVPAGGACLLIALGRLAIASFRY